MFAEFPCCLSVFFLQLGLLVFCPGISSAGFGSSQVLVLYNADWTEDLPGTEPGQDSREVALYYEKMHADPASGERPHVLGLRCVHGKDHLSSPWISERSADNWAGVVCDAVGREDSVKWLRDSRRVEIRFPEPSRGFDWSTLRVELRPVGAVGQQRNVIRDGQPVPDPAVSIDEEEETTVVRLNARRWFAGTVEISIEIKRRNGTTFSERQTYFDILDVRPSRTGPDGTPDDLHYLEDVEVQVKSYLEAPDNALPGGTLLKDHILHVVLCYGLPRTTVFHYGIARGATRRPGDHGPQAALGQRLALMYADVESLMGFRVGPLLFSGGGVFTRWVFRTGLVRQMLGSRANPYLHPWAFNKKKTGPFPQGIAFSEANRSRLGRARYLYSVMRVDGPSPRHAKALVDNAVYASRYLTPRMGRPGDEKTKSRASTWRDFFGAQDLTGQRGGKRPSTGLLHPGQGFWGDSPTYLPGGIDHQVISHNVLGAERAAVTRMLHDNVTFTGGGAAWTPHITNLSWWDDNVLWPLLLEGSSLGDALRQTRMYEGWITSYFGDPLFAPNQNLVTWDQQPPRFLDQVQSCQVEVSRGCLTYLARVTCEVANSVLEPEVAQLRVSMTSQDGEDTRVAEEGIFLTKPSAIVHGLAPNSRYTTTAELQDPYGNRSLGQGVSIVTGPPLVCGVDRVDLERLETSRPPALPLPLFAPGGPSTSSGQLDLVFTFQGGDRLDIIKGKTVSLEWRRGVWSFSAGGSVALGSQQLKTGDTYRLRVCWAKNPVLREVYVLDGPESRRLAEENRVPWNKAIASDRLAFQQTGLSWKYIEIRAHPD